ncbi:MAG TPA: hypothetical protein VGM88_16105 [Kofleriaceae bacterium]|jgi:AraC-like DNA-binding protein
MLSATSTRAFHGSTLHSTVFLERQLRVHLVRRDRLLFASKFAPPARKPGPWVHIFASIRGTFAVDHGATHGEPVAYALAESEFDAIQPDAITFRSFGDPCTIVEVRLLAKDLRVPLGLRHGPLALPPVAWDAYRALEATPGEPQMRAVIDQLGRAKIVASDLADTIVAEEPERFSRLWTVLRPLYEELSTSASLKQIAGLAQLSLRQLGRDLGDVTRTFGLYGGGFRDAMRTLRLRAAVLLLSAPSGTPSDVARAVGYGSLDAMGRAFRDAGLPAPSAVQDSVRFPSI